VTGVVFDVARRSSTRRVRGVDNDVLPAKRAGLFAVHTCRGRWGHLQDGREADARIDSLDELPGVPL